jgi:hypothetical protein
MGENTVNWLINTCLLGLIPVIARLLVWAMSTDGIDPIAVSDLVAFGLVLHSANVNEVSRVGGDDSNWRTIHNGVSVLFICIYGLLMFAAISSPNNINESSILHTTAFLGFASFALSWSIFWRAKSVKGGAGGA